MARVEDAFHVYDTTLRDGAQQEGLNLSVADKLTIARHLDGLGVGFIEGGWPGANPKDTEFFARARDELKLENALLCAFGSTRRPGGVAADDPMVAALRESGAPVVTLVAKAHDRHVQLALRTTLDENLAMISDTVAHLVAEGQRVFLDAEHFFDGYRSNPDYALEVVRTAVEAGAEQLVGAVLHPAGDVGARGSAVGWVVLEAAVGRRVVRRRHADAVGVRASGVGREDRPRDRRGGRVAAARVDADVDVVGEQDLERAHGGRLGERVRVGTQEQRPVDPVRGAVLADRLGRRKDVVLVEARRERRPAMAAGAERHPLARILRIGVHGEVGRHQLRDVDEVGGGGGLSCTLITHVADHGTDPRLRLGRSQSL